MMYEMSLMDMVAVTLGVLIGMALISCICCISMKFSDMKLKCYLVELAKKKGLEVDVDKLDPKNNCPSPNAKDNCTIIIPEVGIVF